MVRLAKDEALERLAREEEQSTWFGGCVMCRLAHASNAAAWIADSQHGVVVLDQYGATRGHLLVIARQHVERASALSWEVYSELQRLVWEATRTVERVFEPERTYTATLGATKQISTSFPHHHCHVVPIYETGERARPAAVFSWSEGVVCYESQEAQELASLLRRSWEGASSRDRADVTPGMTR